MTLETRSSSAFPQGERMNQTCWILGAFAALIVTTAHATDLRYTATGAPDFSRYIVGHTPYSQVITDLGQPMTVGTDANGIPTAAVYRLPLHGDTSTANGAVTNAATSAAKSSLMATVSSHVGSVLSHVPGIAGVAAAHAADTASTQANQAMAGAREEWECTLFFAHGTYEKASCSTINKPVGT
jgi:hypothetical protein